MPEDDGPGRPPRFRRPTGALSDDIPPETLGTRPDIPLTGDSPSPDPTPVFACLDCEAAWVDPGDEWGYCPRCGEALTDLEGADA